MSRFWDDLGGKQLSDFFTEASSYQSHQLVKWLSCSQGGGGRKGRSGEGSHTVLPYIFLQTHQKTRPGGRVHPSLPGAPQVIPRAGAKLEPQGGRSWGPRLPSWSFGVVLAGSQRGSVSCATFPSFCLVLSLFRHLFFQIQYLFSVLSLPPLIFPSPVFSLGIYCPHFIPSPTFTSQAKDKRNNCKQNL